MNVRERLSVTTKLSQARGRRGGGRGRLVSGAFPGRRGARTRRGYMSIELDLVRVFSELVDAVRR